jgi:tRNA(Arg) A34 adenosine deaminase TadA
MRRNESKFIFSNAGTHSKTTGTTAAFTAETLSTDHPVPFGADIVSTATGERLMRAVNRVGPNHDPSAHAET